LASASGVFLSADQLAAKTRPDGAVAATQKPGTPQEVPGTGEVPDWVKSMLESDMDGIGPDGKPDPNYNATGTGHARRNVDPNEAHEMTLTAEEQAILDGSEGDIKARVMKTVVAFGNAFGATHLVDLGGAPHTSMYNAPLFMEPMIEVFEKCADAGLTSYAPFTVNPRAWLPAPAPTGIRPYATGRQGL
jgi:hypothetical protein